MPDAPSRPSPRRVLGRATLLTALAVGLAGCGGAKIGSTASGSGTPGPVSATATAGTSAKPCGTVNLAVNPWVGYEADAAVVTEVAQSRLGCTVTQKNLDEQVSWQGFSTGEIDAVLENWGHEDLKKKYITDQKVAVEVGPTGNKGAIGWYVPPWLAQKYPDITSYKNLNRYAAMFRTSESGGKGQLLDGDPSFVTNDGAIVKNLGLDFKVVYAGSEAALITAFRQAQARKTPVLGYFYDPQWFMSEVPLVKVALPPYTPGCDANTEKVACDYPAYDLDKIASARFAGSGSPAYTLVKNFRWTNEDQDTVAAYIAQDKMTPAAAAKKWVAANPGKVTAWLAGT